MSRIKEILRMHGIKRFTPPQEEAYRVISANPDRLRLVVCSNTGSGKTLIAEMALTRVEPGGKKALYLVPLKALADQVYTLLRSVFGELGYRVVMKVGNYDEKVKPGDWDIMVATYEKADSMIRNGFPVESIGSLVIDEVHTLSSDRGTPIELVISMLNRTEADIVLLSATIGNPEELAEWISGELVVSDYRPVKLHEGYFSEGEVVFPGDPSRNFRVKNWSRGATSTETAIDIAMHFLSEGKPILVFASSRRTAESMAKRIARKLPKATVDTSDIGEFIESKYEREQLEPLIKRGAAFHHGGLSLKTRSYIELLFRAGDIKIVAATPTLAAGVNLPPYAVLVPVRRFNGRRMAPISVMEYKQMAGRAGRPGYAPEGLSIIYDAEENLAQMFINGSAEPIIPKLASPKALRTQINALVAMGIRDVSEVLSNSFTAFRGMIDPYSVNETVTWLTDHGFITMDMKPTPLGKITSRMYVDPEAVNQLLTMIYSKTPETEEEIIFTIAASSGMDYRPSVNRRERETLEAEMDHLADTWPPVEHDYEFYSTAKLTRILVDWISEVDDEEIYEKWRIGPGDLMVIRENAEWLAHAFTAILNVEGYSNLSGKYSEIELRLHHGVRRELIELVKVRGVGRVRARILWEHGVRSVDDLVAMPPEKLVKLPKFGPKVVKRILADLGVNVDIKVKEKHTIADYLR